MGVAEYQEYLKSETWLAKRAVALERALHRCQICNTGRDLEVHHRKYPETLGQEPVEDLTVLCHKHHSMFDHWGRFPEQQKVKGKKYWRKKKRQKMQQNKNERKHTYTIEQRQPNVKVTIDFLRQVTTKENGYTKEILRLLGVKQPPPIGWKIKLIGKEISFVNYQILQRIIQERG